MSSPAVQSQRSVDSPLCQIILPSFQLARRHRWAYAREALKFKSTWRVDFEEKEAA